MKRTPEEELCGMLKEGRCVAGQELENARQVIRELREEKADREKAWAEETRALEQCEKGRVKADEEIARLDAELEAMKKRVPDDHGCQVAREEAEKLRADVAGLELELDAVRSAMKANDELLAEERKVFMKFVAECAELLGLPKLDGCSEYGGSAIRRGIEEMKKKLKRFRAALDKINEIRNDIVGRQSIGWSKHIYPLVAALNEVGFEGMDYEKAREKVEATIQAAQEMADAAFVAVSSVSLLHRAIIRDAFVEILFPFLETLEFYALLGNWQDMKGGQKESACDRDLGGLARATLGHPDRNVPEIIEDGDETA